MSTTTKRDAPPRICRNVDLRFENPRSQFSSWRDAFTDGWLDGSQDAPYDDYRVVKKCHCKIALDSSPFEVYPRDLAVVFYRGGNPVRLLLASDLTDHDMMIASALSIAYQGQTLATHLRNVLACRGEITYLDGLPSSGARSLGTFFESTVCPFGSAEQLFVRLKPKFRRQRPSGGFDLIDAEYVFRKEFRMTVEAFTGSEIICNEYRGALVCRNEEAIYPILSVVPNKAT